jgi:hypothetical protein
VLVHQRIVPHPRPFAAPDSTCTARPRPCSDRWRPTHSWPSCHLPPGTTSPQARPRRDRIDVARRHERRLRRAAR